LVITIKLSILFVGERKKLRRSKEREKITTVVLLKIIMVKKCQRGRTSELNRLVRTKYLFMAEKWRWKPKYVFISRLYIQFKTSGL
jgi:hypothetical protein